MCMGKDQKPVQILLRQLIDTSHKASPCKPEEECSSSGDCRASVVLLACEARRGTSTAAGAIRIWADAGAAGLACASR